MGITDVICVSKNSKEVNLHAHTDGTVGCIRLVPISGCQLVELVNDIFHGYVC